MCNPKVSVIMPVYNTAKYLVEAIESIRASIFSDWELLLIDDGSTDDSISIARNYAKKDERIISVELTHGGVSHARNTGIDMARGEYILFVDSDDLIHPRLIGTMYENGTKNNAELITEPVLMFKGEVPSCDNNETAGVRVVSSQKDLCVFYRDSYGITGRIGGVMVKRSLAMNKFNEEMYRGEDTLFTYASIFSSSVWVVIDASWYYYRKHETNAINNNDVESINNLILCYYEIVKLAEKQGDLATVKFFKLQISFAIIGKSAVALERHDEEFVRTVSNLKNELFPDNYLNWSLKRLIQYKLILNHPDIYMALRSVKRKTFKGKVVAK